VAHQPLPSHCHLSATCGLPACPVGQFAPAKMIGWILTLSYNGYNNGSSIIKCVVRCQIKPIADDSDVPPDASRGRYNSFLLNPTPSGWIDLQRADSPHVRPNDPHIVSNGTRLCFEQSVVEMCIWHSSYPMFIKVSWMVHKEGPDDPKYMWYFQKVPDQNNLCYSRQSVLEPRTARDILIPGSRI
jgi:hypothetical protein